MSNWVRKRAQELSELLVTFYILCVLMFALVFASLFSAPLGVALSYPTYAFTLVLMGAAALYVARSFLTQFRFLGPPRVDEVLLLVVLLPGASALLWYTAGFVGAKVVLIIPAVVAAAVLGTVRGTLLAVVVGGLVFFIDYRVHAGLSPDLFRLDVIVFAVIVLLAWLVAGLIGVERRAQAELAGLADRDPLTGLLSHRRLLEDLARSVEEARAAGRAVALVLLDLDQFRHYNSRLGYAKGDEILALMGEAVKEKLPAGAYAARSGGARFALVLPGKGRMEAVELGEDLCLAMRERLQDYLARLPVKDPALSPVINYGLALYPVNATEAGALYQAAEDDLFRIKYSQGKSYLYKSVMGHLDSLKVQEAFHALQTFVALVNARDRYTFGHSERVLAYSLALAEKLDLSEEDKTHLRFAAYLHDIGKIEVPQEILNKPTRLSDEEWEVMKQHPVWGSEMLAALRAFRRAAEAVRSHHENYDGSGYPDGLKGEAIPFLARVIRLADSFDAMTSSRPYRRSFTFAEALQELVRNAGILYDPELVPVFVSAMREYERVGLLA
ncbi:MAG: bifunctional diguanylate cyclase/phosphohydrolase [Moorellales bacterium]